MTLLDILRENIAVKRVKIGFWGETEQDFENKVASDISMSVFTDDGLLEFRDLFKLPIKRIKDGCIYIDTNDNVEIQDKISRLWSIYTCLGPFDWEGKYDNTDAVKKCSDEDIKDRMKYFEYTSEMVSL